MKYQKNHFSILLIIFIILIFHSCNTINETEGLTLFPTQNATNINPDTHLKLTFPGQPTIGNIGTIPVYDSKTDSLIDFLDMSIPAGPTEPKKILKPIIAKFHTK